MPSRSPATDVPTVPRPALHRPRRGRPGRMVLVLGLIAAVAAVAFPFAPVQQPQVTYRWSALDGATAIPLLPYQPVDLTAAVTCAAARVSDRDGTVLLSTVPLRADPRAASLAGLTITTDRGLLRVESAGVPIATPAIGAGECTVSVSSRYERTVVAVDGTAVAVREGDVRPAVAGMFTDLPAVPGIELAFTADTRFQTTIGAGKAAIGVVGVLALLGMLLAVRAADGRVRAVRVVSPGWWRPRPVDGAVGLVLTVWWIVGGITVDDGYIAGIVRSTGSNGMVGNVYRWLNAPEAPFSWFYELYHAWAQVSASTVWMRLPSTLLGLLCWVLLSRFVLPRLGRCARRPVVPWLAAVALLAWWVPFNLGLRPEPWVGVGMLGVFVGIERAVATRRVLPLAIALIVAGVTTAVTPAGLIAFMPVLAAAGPLVRLLRARTDLHVAPILALLVAAPAAALLLMAADQSMAAMLEATRVRRLIGGGQPWHQEIQRYATLLEPDGFQGAIGRRAPVLLGLAAAAGAAWTLARRDRCGIAAGPARRLVLGFGLGLAAMTLSPTKWTQHFGDLAGYGAAVLVLGLVAWSGRGPVRVGSGRALAVGWGVVLAASALVLAGRNLWPYASDWYGPVFSAAPPRFGGMALASFLLVGGALAVAALLARSAWLRAGGAPDTVGRRVPAPASGVLVVLVAVVALQVGSLGAVAVQRPDGYTLASDAVATLRGEPCGLQRLLSVETDPAAGLLPPRTDDALPAAGRPAAVAPVDTGNGTLPGIAVAGDTTTGWFAVEASEPLPVVVTVSGPARPGDGLFVEFGGADGIVGRTGVPVGDGTSEVRLPVPAGADAVRLVTEATPPAAERPALASLPRVPRVTPMTRVLPPGTVALLDWPVAFLFGCLTPAPLPHGTADLPRWRVAPPASDPSAGITYAPGFGGPFAGPRLLVTEHRVATYLAGDPLRDAVQLYRWVPVEPLTVPVPETVDRTVAGWHADGRTRVPGLDPVG